MGTLLDPDGLLTEIHPDTHRAVRRLVRQSDATVRVRSGRRSCAEQRDLYGIGRRYNVGSPPVTHADGCRSWHVLGRAVDLDILDPATGRAVVPCAAYEALGVAWEQMGGVWGGRFSGFGSCGDAGHFEWHPGATIEDYCPDPSACEEVEVAIDRQISTAHTMRMVATAGVAFSILAIGSYSAWHILRK